MMGTFGTALRAPVYLASHDPPSQPSRQTRSDQEAAPSTRARILVVEDEHLVGVEAQQVLTAAGHDVVGVVSTGWQALDLALSAAPDLILMDIRLAGQTDGIAAARVIRVRTGIRCLFATAYADDAARERAAPADPLGWLTKPYTRAGLLAAVSRALDEVK